MIEIHKSNCLDLLKALPKNCIDSIVTDPPYGLSFMGKKWDYDVPSKEIWTECLRVLKPGGHLLSFGGTRTYHRLVVNIEDAGFEIRDCIQWLYGSGFPKSTDVSKRIDKEAGAQREIVGINPNHRGESQMKNPFTKSLGQDGTISASATESAKQWQGWGTALKPANEPICVARKPLEKGLTVAENVQKWGTGALNIDGSRINYASESDKKNNTEALARFNSTSGNSGTFMASKSIQPNLAGTSLGRWPANIILDEEAAAALDEQSIENGIHSAGKKREKKENFDQSKSMFGIGHAGGSSPRYEESDNIGASRFFYVAKASKRERGEGNNHPTVKPIKLMEYLIKLVTPPSGIVLDPFMGSGSTGVAAKKLGFTFIGCELNDEYFDIASNRLD